MKTKGISAKVAVVDKELKEQKEVIQTHGIAIEAIQRGLVQIGRETNECVSRGTSQMTVMLEKAMENMKGFIKESVAGVASKEEGQRVEEKEKVQRRNQGDEEEGRGEAMVMAADAVKVQGRNRGEKEGKGEAMAMAVDAAPAERNGRGERDLRHPDRRRAADDERGFPAVVITGWQRPNPGRERVKEVFAMLGLGGVPIRKTKVVGSRGQVVKVLLWTNVDKERIMRNKYMLRSSSLSKLFIKEDRYPMHWKEEIEDKREQELKSSPERKQAQPQDQGRPQWEPQDQGRPRREPQDQGRPRREQGLESWSPERRQIQPQEQGGQRRFQGPRTAMFQEIFEQLEREAKNGQGLGNGQRFRKSRRARGNGGRTSEATWGRKAHQRRN